VESERLLRVVRVRSLARDVFTTDTAVGEWMNRPQNYLDGQTPLEALETGLGATRVENLARSMVHGVPV
jgi:putative toxin-antitoxin system antitoxin component (TIGR02293 family)